MDTPPKKKSIFDNIFINTCIMYLEYIIDIYYTLIDSKYMIDVELFAMFIYVTYINEYIWGILENICIPYRTYVDEYILNIFPHIL